MEEEVGLGGGLGDGLLSLLGLLVGDLQGREALEEKGVFRIWY
jgi:hypothetical protein